MASCVCGRPRPVLAELREKVGADLARSGDSVEQFIAGSAPARRQRAARRMCQEGAMQVILDASAVLAYLLREPGGEGVASAIDLGAGLGIANLAEIMTRLVRDGVS